MYSLSPASSRCATLVCSHCMRSWPRSGTPRQALAHSKFILHSTSTFMVMDSPDSPRIIPLGRDLENRASQFSCGFLSLSLNLGQCARGWSSAHVSKASYVEAIHELHQHLQSLAFEMLRAQVSWSHKYWIFQCALLCPSPCCLLWTVPHWSPCAVESGRLYPSLWRTPELPSTLLLRALPAYSSASAVLVATVLCCFVQALIKCFSCKIMPPLTDFLDCLSPAQSA